MKYDIYNNRYRMVKRGQVLPTTAAAVGGVATAAPDIAAWAISILTAATVAAGVGLGWSTAKLTSHGKQSADVLRMGYENERLKSDLGYVAARTLHEQNSRRAANAPTAARILGN